MKNFKKSEGANFELWYKLEENVYESLYSMVNFFSSNQSWKEAQNLRALRLYGDYKNVGLAASQYAFQGQETSGAGSRITYNVIKSVCDTYQAQIAKQNTKVTFLTDGGDWSMQRKAKLLEKFIGGIMYQTKAQTKMKMQALDSAVFGTAAHKVYRQGKKICFDRVFINELRVDEAEAIYGQPRTLYQTRAVSRDTMLAEFPEHKEIILEAGDITQGTQGYQNMADMITVVEAWHLPSAKDSGDGRHAICLTTGDLLFEEYTKDHFPFIFTKTGERLLGFWGQGFAEQLTGLQYELNSTLQTIQLATRLCSVPKVFVEIGSKVVPAQLNNEIGGIIFYSGQRPTYQAIQAVSPELFRQVDTLINRAYELVGLSQLSASSKKPAGLASGVALREYKDVENERFAIMQQSFEQNYLTLAGYFIELAKEIHEEFGEFEISAESNKALNKIKWSEVDLDKESYRMKIYPSSALPTSPAGKLEKVIELYQAGFFSKEEAFSLLDFPDLEAASSRIGADYNDIMMVIEKMIHEGKYQTPEPYQNLELGVKEVQRSYLKARMDNVPSDRLELLRSWISQAQYMMNLATPPPPPPQMAGMGGMGEMQGMGAGDAPIASAMPSPVSPLVPLPNA